MADPNWQFDDQGSRASPDYVGEDRSEALYKTMGLDDIKALGRRLFVDRDGGAAQLAADDAFLFLWAPSAFLVELDDEPVPNWEALSRAATVALAWGFTPRQVITWCKTTKTGRPALCMGHYSRGGTEHMLLCRRGKAQVARRDMVSWFLADKTRHSEKPFEANVYVEQLTGADRFLEMFARRRYSKRWVCHGDQAPRNQVHPF